MAEGPVLRTVDEARADLRLSRAKLYRLLATGELESLKIGRCRRIPAEAIERFVAQRMSEAA